MDAGDPEYGAYSERIGNFHSRARQLTSQAFGRAKAEMKTAAQAVFLFPPDCPKKEDLCLSKVFSSDSLSKL